jgi:hypothetical protein
METADGRRAVKLIFLVCLATLLVAQGPEKPQEKRHMTRASGTFDVKVTPAAGESPAGFVRLALDKHFHGALEASSVGEMMASNAGGSDSGGYVALERVTGKLDGRSGGFVLQHSGVMSPGSMRIDVQITPGSGTGDLAGIAGTLTIRIEGKQHFYDLDYTLPAAN